MVRALILGGTGEANRLANALAREKIDAIYSYAGRTQIPLGHSLPVRIGGFGGTDGLADFIRRERITHMIDATPPFAGDNGRETRDATCGK
jgi:precorrin-6A/cobalt-precorrin-6A reductase